MLRMRSPKRMLQLLAAGIAGCTAPAAPAQPPKGPSIADGLYKKPAEAELKSRLTPLKLAVTQREDP